MRRQMALVAETYLGGDIGDVGNSDQKKFFGSQHPAAKQILVGGQACGLFKHASEMKGT